MGKRYDNTMKIIKKIIQKQSSLSQNPAVTIGVLGDSVSQGCFECYLTSEDKIETVFDTASSYASRLKEMLNLLYPRVQFNMINAGISGDNAQGGLKRIDRDILAYHPDLVILGFALNDSTTGMDGIQKYKAAMSEMIRKITASGAECIVLTPNAMNTEVSCHLREKPLVKMAKSLEKIQNDGILDAYAQAARDVAEQEGAVLCDVYALWKSMIEAGVDVTDLLANHLNHPLRRMHYLTAMKLCECILK